jgi:hypothetical protein
MTSADSVGGRHRAEAERARAGWAIVAAALALGLAGDLLLRVGPWGLNAALWFAGLCVAAAALPRLKWLGLPGPRGAAWLHAALAFSLLLMWRSSPVLQAVDVMAILFCLGMAAFPANAATYQLASLTEYAASLSVAALYAVVGGFELVIRHLDWRSIGRPERSARLVAVGRGLAIAAVPMVVFGGLFASADVFFRGLLQEAVPLSPAEALSHLLLWSLISWIAGGYLWGVFLAQRGPVPEAPRTPSLRFEFIETGVVFGLVDGLFLAFVGVQFRYLFGGAGRVESSSTLTYAEYARRGFFELVAVAVLVAPFVVITHWLLTRGQLRLQRFYAVFAGLLVALVYVVMASALQRMRLYQETFGLTELRLYTTAFMVWLIAVFAWLTLTILRGRRDRFTFGVVMAGLALILGLNVLNPDAYIIRRNAAIADTGRRFDSQYALDLSADAVPSLIANFDVIVPDERCSAAKELRRRYAGAEEDWRTWTWSRLRARRAVESSSELATACEGK